MIYNYEFHNHSFDVLITIVTHQCFVIFNCQIKNMNQNLNSEFNCQTYDDDTFTKCKKFKQKFYKVKYACVHYRPFAKVLLTKLCLFTHSLHKPLYDTL